MPTWDYIPYNAQPFPSGIIFHNALNHAHLKISQQAMNAPSNVHIQVFELTSGSVEALKANKQYNISRYMNFNLHETYQLQHGVCRAHLFRFQQPQLAVSAIVLVAIPGF